MGEAQWRQAAAGGSGPRRLTCRCLPSLSAAALSRLHLDLRSLVAAPRRALLASFLPETRAQCAL